MAAYRLTTARRKALRKAQLVSARKRKGRGISRKTQARIGIAGTAALIGVAAYGRHKLSGSSLHGPYGPTSVPMTRALRGDKIVSVPATSAGLRVSNYDMRNGFAMTLKARAFGKESLLFGYRHKPLTAEGIKNIVGRKLRGGTPADVTKWNPVSARKKSPTRIDMGIIEGFRSGRAFTPEERARRKVARRGSSGMVPYSADRLRQFPRPSSAGYSSNIGGTLARSRRINTMEAILRGREYERIMAARGININAAHRTIMGRILLRENK
jgi:hypothetical protein